MEGYNYEQELVKLQNEWEKKNRDNRIFEDNIDFSGLVDIDEELFFPRGIDDIYSLGTITDKEIDNVSNEVCEKDLKFLQTISDEVNIINSVTKKEIINVANQDPKNSISVLDPKPYLQLIDNLLMDEIIAEKNVFIDHNYGKKLLKSSEKTEAAINWKNKLPMTLNLYKIEKIGSSNVFRCNLCLKIYKSKKSLRNHLSNTHTGMMYEVCKTCNKAFRISYIKKHIKIHSQKKVYCEYCKKSFVHDASFSQHVHNMDVEKKFRCDLCGMKSFHKYLMERHMKFHEKKKPIN